MGGPVTERPESADAEPPDPTCRTPAPTPHLALELRIEQAPPRVIVIDASRGFQVGQGNVEYVRFNISPGKTNIRVDKSLVHALIVGDASSLSDIFEHTGKLSIKKPINALERLHDSEPIRHYDDQNLVIVKRCDNFQIGDRNTLRAEFDVRVANFQVDAATLNVDPARREHIDRLIENPEDLEAIKALAEDILESAQEFLEIKLEAQFSDLREDPAILDFNCRVQDREGFQVGPNNVYHQSIEVNLDNLTSKALNALSRI